jgi:hypothetical protein
MEGACEAVVSDMIMMVDKSSKKKKSKKWDE